MNLKGLNVKNSLIMQVPSCFNYAIGKEMMSSYVWSNKHMNGPNEIKMAWSSFNYSYSFRVFWMIWKWNVSFYKNEMKWYYQENVRFTQWKEMKFFLRNEKLLEKKWYFMYICKGINAMKYMHIMIFFWQPHFIHFIEMYAWCNECYM